MLGSLAILQTPHSSANAGALGFLIQSCGVYDSRQVTYKYSLCGIFYFPWHRHQIEGTKLFVSVPKDTGKVG